MSEKSIQSLGGEARALAMSSEERSQCASKAAKARMTLLCRPVLRTACPHCVKARTSLLCWRIAGVIGWALAFVLITFAK